LNLNENNNVHVYIIYIEYCNIPLIKTRNVHFDFMETLITLKMSCDVTIK